MLIVLARAITYLLALAALGLAVLLYHRIRSRWGLALWFPKVLAGSLAPLLVGVSALSALMGLWLHAPLAALAGAVGAVLSAVYVGRMAGQRVGLAVPSVHRSWRPGAQPRWERDIPFWQVPGCARPLLCDLWRPPVGVEPSGVALVYYHSSAWHLSDKDVWTRPLFQHLTEQGHVVMDVAYRLCPEVDLFGMLGDAKRAIAWMKANAARYDVDPERVVAAGASAGGQLALLAAYTPGHPALTPADLRGSDTSVRAVVSCYGVTDLRAFCQYTGSILPGTRFLDRVVAGPLLRLAERITSLIPGIPIAGQLWKLGSLSESGIIGNLLGLQAHESSALWDLASPVAHAGVHCPPTFLIQGAHDTVIPLPATQALAEKLAGEGVPVVSVVLPNTDHMYDLVLPQVSPAARVALAHLDRFLAQLA